MDPYDLKIYPANRYFSSRLCKFFHKLPYIIPFLPVFLLPDLNLHPVICPGKFSHREFGYLTRIKKTIRKDI